jgi:hypothetical protein
MIEILELKRVKKNHQVIYHHQNEKAKQDSCESKKMRKYYQELFDESF